MLKAASYDPRHLKMGLKPNVHYRDHITFCCFIANSIANSIRWLHMAKDRVLHEAEHSCFEHVLEGNTQFPQSYHEEM